jgi:CRP-like cAMP-binding protein
VESVAQIGSHGRRAVVMRPLVLELGAALHAEIARFFPDVHEDTRDRLVAQAIVRPFRRGDILSRQGDPLGVTLILSGFIATRNMGLSGQNLTLGICGTGRLIGLSAVRGSSPAPFGVAALTDGYAALWDGSFIRGVAEEDASLILRLFDLHTQTVASLHQRLQQVTFNDARQRLAMVILAYGTLLSALGPVISRREVASLIGVTREMLGHAIRDLEAKKAVSRFGHQILILDRPALEEIADWSSAGRAQVEALSTTCVESLYVEPLDEAHAAAAGNDRTPAAPVLVDDRNRDGKIS